MNENQRISYVTSGDEVLSLRVYNVGHEQCGSMHQWGPGIRKFFLIHHVVSGKGFYRVGKKTYEINKGSTFLIYPNTQIMYCADAEEPWEYYWVGFQGNDARAILKETDFTEENPVIYQDMDEYFESLFMEIYHAKGNDASSKIKMSGYLMLALSMLAEKASPSKSHKPSSSIYVQKALEYIEYNYTQKLTVQDIADYIGISRSQLFRVFKEHFQKSTEVIILEYRIQQACDLLKNSDLSIGAVGYSVGFEDNLYFSKAFKKVKGISPREYVRRLNEVS